MIPKLKEGQYKSTIAILDGKTVLKKGEVFDEIKYGIVNVDGDNLHIRKVGDGVTKYSKLPIELEYYSKFDKLISGDL